MVELFATTGDYRLGAELTVAEPFALRRQGLATRQGTQR